MQKYITAGFMIILLAALHTKAFAGTLTCKFTDRGAAVQGVETLHIEDDTLIVNQKVLIPLKHISIKCGQFGRQHRFDGIGKGLHIILRSCTDRAVLEGQLIDATNSVSVDVACDETI